MAISELTQLVTPPAHPLQADDGEAIRAVERFLGSALPRTTDLRSPSLPEAVGDPVLKAMPFT